MKEKLLKLLAAKKEQRDALNKSIIECESKEERAAIGETLSALAAEIAEVEAMLADLDEPADDNNGEASRGLNPMQTMEMRGGNQSKKEEAADPYDTKEYREAFMNFITRGTAIPMELRGDAVTKTTDTSAVIPTTMLHEIVKELKSYGNIYSAVRKLNVQGGVSIPILSIKPTATWITADTATSESDKKKLQANSSVIFNYYGLECKLAQTLLVNVTTIDAFQELFVSLAAEAMVKALDIAIIKGTGSGQPVGVTVDDRVPEANVITLTAAQIVKWDEWKKKVFAKMKKSYRDGVFYMSQATFDGYIDGMVDGNGQPIGRINYGIDGGETYRFGGKAVETVEDDVIAAYEDADSGDVIAVFFKPSDYAINSNLEMQTVKWIDHDTNEIKNKVIMICDGKLVDPNGVLVIKKG